MINDLKRSINKTYSKVTPENSVSMFWQIPQYVIMTAGEILFSVSTMEFCYTQVVTL